jgi:hypothetical protein
METPQQVKKQQLERVWRWGSGRGRDARHKGKYPAFAAKDAAKAGYLGWAFQRWMERSNFMNLPVRVRMRAFQFSKA